MSVTAAAPPQLSAYEHLLLPSFQYSDGSLEEVRADVASGQASFWPGRESVAITRENVDPAREMVLWLVGGNLRELMRMERSWEAHARSRGLDRIVAEVARPGWQRVLSRLGYRVTMVKDL
jgi:hypothetical protein